MWGSLVGASPTSATRARRLSTAWLAVAVAIALLVALAPGHAPRAEATEPEPGVHGGQVVPEMPNWQADRIIDGRVLAGDRVGDVFVIGGTFTEIELADGTIVDQPYLAAFRVDNGRFVHEFRPELNNSVLAIEAGRLPDTVFVSGKFTTIDAESHPRLALLRTSDGSTEPDFDGNVSGAVKALELRGDHLYVGGSFQKVSSQSQQHLARVSAITGEIDPTWTIEVTGSRATGRRDDGFRYTASGPVVRDISITPDGSRMAVSHRGDLVGGVARWGLAMIDLGPTPSVSAWDASDLWPASDFVGVVEADMAPDGSYVAMSLYVGNFPPLHDTVIAFPVAGTGDVGPLWVTQMFDSVYGVAVSDAAVYTGGHFCWTEGPHDEPDPISWPGASGNGYSCQRTGGGVFDNTVYRNQMAALDPVTGHALAYDPGSNAGNGIRFMRVIDRGLMIGHDGSRINGRNVGGFGFQDLGAAFDTTQQPPACSVTEVDGTVTIEWLENAANYWGMFVNGQWFRRVDDFNGGMQLHTPAGGTWNYVVRSVFDGNLKEDADCGTVVVDEPPPPAPACQVVLNGDDTVTVSWDEDDANRHGVFRNGTWLTSYTDATTSHVNDPGPGTHAYVVRSVFGPGDKVDTDCGSITIDEPPPPAPACQVVLNGDDTVTVSWDEDDANRHGVFRNGTWLASYTDATTSHVNDPGPGTHAYVVRSVFGPDDKVDTDCGSVTIG